MILFATAAVSLGVSALLFAQRPEMPQGGFMRMNPILAALDADQDGVISKAERENGPKALAALDKNGNGSLEMEETRPQFGGRGRGPEGERREGERREGPGGGGADLLNTLMGFDANKDGMLSKTELPERMQGMLARGDKNGDNQLSKEEIEAMTTRASQGGPGGRGGGERGEGRGGFGGPGGPGGMRRPDAVRTALDTDQDGIISSGEIKASASALKSLDKNSDGLISEDEVRPSFGGRRPEGENH